MPVRDRRLCNIGGFPVTLQTLVLRYAFFAVLATLANLAMQRLVLGFGEGGFVFALAVLTGTLAGLTLKYVLDKRWIFRDQTAGVKAHSMQFTLYTAMGIVTTAIFWGAETTFWMVWKTDAMRELGAILGLGVGYVVKYRLDRRFVFTDARMVHVP